MKTLFLIFLILFPVSVQGQRKVKSATRFGNKYDEGIFMADLAQTEQFKRLASHVEEKIAKGEKTTIEHLFWLCTSYEALCNYDRLFTRITLLENKVRQEDNLFYGNDMAVYPFIYRAKYYQSISDFHRAVEQATAGHELLHREGRQSQNLYRYQLIDLQGILGTSQALLGNYVASQQAVKEISAVSLHESNLGPEKYTAVARIHMANREFEKALSSITDPRATVDARISQHYNTSFQDLPKLFIYYKSLYELGRYDEAKSGYDNLLAHVNIEQMGSMHWILLLDRAQIHLLEGAPEQAVRLLKQAVAITEQIRSSIRTEAGRIGFVENKQLIYQTLIGILMDSGRHKEAYRYVERSKARALVDLLGSVGSFKVENRSSTESKALLEELNSIESELEMSRNSGDIPARNRGFGLWQEKRNQVLTEAPELGNLVTINPVNVDDVLGMIAPGECLLEYYYTGNRLFIFYLGEGQVRAVQSDLDKKHLSRIVDAFRRAVSSPGSDEYMDYAVDLFDLLVRPVASKLEGKEVVVVPHGVLHYLPFGALHSGQDFLIETVSIRYLPSAEIMRFLCNRESYGLTNGLIIGNPDLGNADYNLEFAEREAKQIAGLVPSSKVQTGSEATETLLKSEGNRYNFLHFACHGLFQTDNPLESSLWLTPDQHNDGRLTAAELYALELNTGLVTLSACETGLGEVSSGDDVIGFTRGLLFAGANSIVSSLWSVDDRSTGELMVRFYGHMNRMERGESLRQAQLETKQRFPHPFYWAPFILIGNSN